MEVLAVSQPEHSEHQQLFYADRGLSLPADSLARPENWPYWARRLEAIAEQQPLDALRAISTQTDLGDFYFLGMPGLSENLHPRRSLKTGADGGYTPDGPAKISLVKEPQCAIMRSLVNRISLHSLPDIDQRCWSGWNRAMQCFTNGDMALNTYFSSCFGFVAIVNKNALADNLVVEEWAGRPNEIHVSSDEDFALRPELILPVEPSINALRDTRVVVGMESEWEAEMISRPELTEAWNQLLAVTELPRLILLRSGRVLKTVSFAEFARPDGHTRTSYGPSNPSPALPQIPRRSTYA